MIRFAELYHQVKFPQALALLHQWRGGTPLLHEAASFYRMQLHRHSEAVAYLHQRGVRSPETDRAHADRLRAWRLPARLADAVGSTRSRLCVRPVWSPRLGYDAYMHRIVFPLEGNLYGRSLSATAPPHRFLPGAKGGLYSWEQVRQYPEVILVEGLFDYAGFGRPVFTTSTCSLGNQSQCAPVSATLRRLREPSI